MEVRVRFWTDGLPRTKTESGYTLVWNFGTVYTIKNNTLAVAASGPVPFNDPTEMLNAVLSACDKAGVLMVRRPKKSKKK